MIKFFIKTYGCQANVADSQAIINFLVDLGCIQVEEEINSEFVIVNTCAIREKAEQKVYSYLGSLAEIKRQKKFFKVCVVGCIASYRKKEFLRRFDHVRFVFGAKENKNKLRQELTDLVLKLESIKGSDVQNERKNFGVTTGLIKRISLELGGIKNETGFVKQSFINIMTGCDNFCSYCIVPFTRGREKSFPAKAILERIKQDVGMGVKEIVLLGQNVNSYKDPETGIGFAKLLEMIANIEGEFWIRFMSPNPKDMSVDVIDTMAEHDEKLCAFVHHPLQSGSNKILKAMNRAYTVETYLEQIGWIKSKLPSSTISTDIIVGFPGETDEDYQKTREIMETVKFDNIFSFIFSPRKYTKAALLKDDCDHLTKLKRLESLQERQKEIAFYRNSFLVGKKLKCLVEKRMLNGKLLARTSGNVRVLFVGDESLIGSFVSLKIEKVGVVNMVGTLVNQRFT